MLVDRSKGKVFKLKMFSVDPPNEFSRDLDVETMERSKVLHSCTYINLNHRIYKKLTTIKRSLQYLTIGINNVQGHRRRVFRISINSLIFGHTIST